MARVRSLLEPAQIVEIVGRAFPKHALKSCEPLTGGMSNLNYWLHVDGLRDSFVVRVFTRDPAACQKEIDVHRLVSEQAPVPEIVYANPCGTPPYILKRYVEGITFQELKSRGNLEDIAEAAYAIGGTLARLGPLTFSLPARFEIDASLSAPVLDQRLGQAQTDRLREFISGWISRISPLYRETHLVHGDFNARNTILASRDGRWVVAGILDWELAFSGSPLWDAARFICYERRLRPLREPHFSAGFRDNGGALPDGWADFSRVINLVSMAESLSRPELRMTFVPELVDLVAATLDDRDPV